MTARADQPTGAFGSSPREEALDMLTGGWNLIAESNGTDTAIPIYLAVAQTSALLYIGDELASLRNELRWKTENDDEPDSPATKLETALNGPKARSKADR